MNMVKCDSFVVVISVFAYLCLPFNRPEKCIPIKRASHFNALICIEFNSVLMQRICFCCCRVVVVVVVVVVVFAVILPFSF